jgi:hypothetical protein
VEVAAECVDPVGHALQAVPRCVVTGSNPAVVGDFEPELGVASGRRTLAREASACFAALRKASRAQK